MLKGVALRETRPYVLIETVTSTKNSGSNSFEIRDKYLDNE